MKNPGIPDRLHQLLPGVSRVYRNYDIQQKKWLTDHPQIRVRCGPGCGYCCNMSVRVNLLEAIMIRENAGERGVAKAVKAGKRILDFARGYHGSEAGYFYAFRLMLKRCSFLARGDRCLIHPFRPLSCREILSGLPGRYCGAEAMENSTAIALRRQRYRLPAGIFRGSPFVFPLIEAGHSFEKQLDARLTDELGLSIRGEMNFLLRLLDQDEFARLLGKGIPGEICAFFEQNQYPRVLVEVT